MTTKNEVDPYENPVADRDHEAEGDDGEEQHHALPLLDDLSDEHRAEIEEQLEQVKLDTETYPEGDHS